MKRSLRDKWTKLYEVACDVCRRKPWEWLEEEKLIIVRAYESLDFYLSVMGMHGMFEGIMLCTSKKALCNYSEMQASNMPDLYGINYQQGILMVFNDEKFSLPENVEIANEFMPRKINNKIITFESFVKGYMPSKITEEELDDALLTYTAFDKMLIAFDKSKTEKTKEQKRIKELQNLLIEDEDKCLIIDYNEDEDTLNFDVTDVPEIAELSFTLDMPKEALAIAKKFKRNNKTYEVELLNCIPIPIGEVDYTNPMMNETVKKNLILRYFIVTDLTSGKVLKFLPYEKPIMSNKEETDYISDCVNQLFEVFDLEGIPESLMIRDEETALVLDDLTKKLKINVTIKPSLDIVDNFIYGFFEHITGESPETIQNMSDEEAMDFIDSLDDDYEDYEDEEDELYNFFENNDEFDDEDNDDDDDDFDDEE